MAYEQLKEDVWRANMGLVEAGLVVLTWGNASGVDRKAGVMAIKPSGVDYEDMHPEDMVVLSLATGELLEGDLRPSSDTPTHLVLYREFPVIGGVTHTHSNYATSFAQAGLEIPCLGTTHADHFYGAVPLTRQLTREEIQKDYELNTGRLIVEYYQQKGLDIMDKPGVLVPYHGPFTWGADPEAALHNAIVLEEVARMVFQTRLINPQVKEIPRVLLDKHFKRKHGPGAYYGQSKT
ncbi:MAG: L-ribulose-5-phosphate 4-epimerase [bacterium]|nr:L-ribulose-5-phosphate 4-epimerase [bacterium]